MTQTTSDQKLVSIDKVLADLAETDTEFWTQEQLEQTIDRIVDIIRPDPNTGQGDAFYFKGDTQSADYEMTEAGWYFWDEEGLFVGPFETYDAANVAIQEYVEALGWQ